MSIQLQKIQELIKNRETARLGGGEKRICESSISNAWIEFDRGKFEDDPIFIEIINWLKDNNI